MGPLEDLHYVICSDCMRKGKLGDMGEGWEGEAQIMTNGERKKQKKTVRCVRGQVRVMDSGNNMVKIERNKHMMCLHGGL